MQPIKRIEIIVNELEVSSVLKVLNKNQISGYTILSNATGKGFHGTSGDDLLTNSYILAACTDEAIAQSVVEGLRPLLSRMGGICMISDALWLKH